MFIRVNTTPHSPRRSIQICETYRVKDKVKQRIVEYVGVANDEWQEQKLKDYATEIIAKLIIENEEKDKQRSLFNSSAQGVLSLLKNKAGRPHRKK